MPRHDSEPEAEAFFPALSRRMYLLNRDYPDAAEQSVDRLFLAYLLECSQFGQFTYGPVSIDVGQVEDVYRRSYPRGRQDGEVAPFSESVHTLFTRVAEEHHRSGRPRVDELHWLLAFMRINEGLPARVFGELGVTPEAVEAYARTRATDDPMREAFYSPEEVAAHLGVKTQTVRAWIRSGRLPASRLAGQRVLRIRASDIASLLEPVAPESEPDTPMGNEQ